MTSALCFCCKADFAIRKGMIQVDNRIKELRRLNKLTQEELAMAVGTTRQTITSIEVGKYTASLPLAYRIARHFGLAIEEVFDFSQEDDKHGTV